MAWTFARLAVPAKYLPLLALLSCSGNNNPPPSPYPGRLLPNSGWTDYGTGTGTSFVGRLPDPFVMPTTPVSVNYVYTAPQPIGKTITLNYSVDGNATFGTVDGGTPAIRLFIWQNNDTGGNTFRWWCSLAAVLKLGDNQTLSCALDPTLWTDVIGQNDAIGFAAAVASPFAVGFTFGGQFAGHGVWILTGSASFKINRFAVQ